MVEPRPFCSSAKPGGSALGGARGRAPITGAGFWLPLLPAFPPVCAGLAGAAALGAATIFSANFPTASRNCAPYNNGMALRLLLLPDDPPGCADGSGAGAVLAVAPDGDIAVA